MAKAENDAARKAKGDYVAAGIQLVPWEDLPEASRRTLWLKMLRGKVANAAEFRPD